MSLKTSYLSHLLRPTSRARVPGETRLREAAASFGLEELTEIVPTTLERPLLYVIEDRVRELYPSGEDPHLAFSSRHGISLRTTFMDRWYFIAQPTAPLREHRLGDRACGAETQRERKRPWLLKVGNVYSGNAKGFIEILERAYRESER